MLGQVEQLIYFIVFETVITFPVYWYGIVSNTIPLVILLVILFPPLIILIINNELNITRLGLIFDNRNDISMTNKINVIIFSYFICVLIYLLSYGIFWILFPDSFNFKYRGVLDNNSYFLLDLTLDIINSIVIWTPIWSLISGLTEEITWRGYFLPALNNVLPSIICYIITGLVWSLFHYPFIFWTPSEIVVSYQIVPLWYTCIFFTLTLISVSIVMGELRLKTGSILTACIIHGSNNALSGLFISRTSLEYHWYLGIGSPIQAILWMIVAALTMKYDFLNHYQMIIDIPLIVLDTI